MKTAAKKYVAPKKPTAIDLFSGCGGLSQGLRAAGFKIVAAVEIEQKSQETYVLNHPEVLLYPTDIRKLTASKVLRDLAMKPGDLDLLAGCPPCQGFSRLRTKNKRVSVKDDRNDLVKEFLRFARVLRPKSVMLENVPSLKKDARFRHLCGELSKLGYQSIVHVLNAADYGVAQRRKRLILMGSRVHVPTLPGKARTKLTVRDLIGQLERPSKTRDTLHAMPENRTPEVRSLIRLVPKNGGSRGDLPKEFRRECHKRSDGFKDVFGRMSWEKVAPTITSGCSNPSKGRFLHPSQNRTITLREAALLQGFPKRYRFDVTHGKESIALMIGNALPPPFIAANAKRLRDGIKAAERCIAMGSAGMKASGKKIRKSSGSLL